MSYSPARVEETPKLEVPEGHVAEALSEPPVPSWFNKEFTDEAGETLAERYRERLSKREEVHKADADEVALYRRRLDERFRQAQNRYENHAPRQDNQPLPRVRRPMMPLNQIQARNERFVRENVHVASPRLRKSRSWLTYASLGILVMALGAGSGYTLANRGHLIASLPSLNLETPKAYLANIVALPGLKASSQQSPPQKPIAMASLAVNDVRGNLNSLIPLALSAKPAATDQPINLEISGLPPAAYLTAGQKAASGRWIVAPADISSVKVFVPQSETPKIDLEVAAIEQRSGQLAAPAQSMSLELADVKVTPAAAPPDGVQLKSEPLVDQSVPGADLVAKANELMNEGDIASARQFYLQASQLGNGKGTYGVARTYDPKVFAEMKIEGLQPDQAKADDWYKKAETSGVN